MKIIPTTRIDSRKIESGFIYEPMMIPMMRPATILIQNFNGFSEKYLDNIILNDYDKVKNH
jgi:hypothetical protein